MVMEKINKSKIKTKNKNHIRNGKQSSKSLKKTNTPLCCNNIQMLFDGYYTHIFEDISFFFIRAIRDYS